MLRQTVAASDVTRMPTHIMASQKPLIALPTEPPLAQHHSVARSFLLQVCGTVSDSSVAPGTVRVRRRPQRRVSR